MKTKSNMTVKELYKNNDLKFMKIHELIKMKAPISVKQRNYYLSKIKQKPKELDWAERMELAQRRCAEIIDLDQEPPVKYTSVKCSVAETELFELNKLHKQILTQQRTELFKDLIKIADSGEFEDMRRELNIYFKGKDE